MSEMVERVAKALEAADRFNYENYRPDYEEQARAAIEAMREFPETDAAALLFGHRRKRWWREMIDAALDNPPKA